MKTENWEEDNAQENNDNNPVIDTPERDSGFQSDKIRKEGNHEEREFKVIDQEDDGEIDYN